VAFSLGPPPPPPSSPPPLARAGMIPVVASFHTWDSDNGTMLEAVPMAYKAILCKCRITHVLASAGGHGSMVSLTLPQWGCCPAAARRLGADARPPANTLQPPPRGAPAFWLLCCSVPPVPGGVC
jgi:hypothetical protein